MILSEINLDEILKIFYDLYKEYYYWILNKQEEEITRILQNLLFVTSKATRKVKQ